MIEKIKKFESKWYNKQKSNMLSFENKQISDIERNIKIIEAIWKKTLTFENECYGEIVTHIGDYWFYFWTGKDFADTITPENIHEKISIFELSQLIRESIEDLDETEEEYCATILGW